MLNLRLVIGAQSAMARLAELFHDEEWPPPKLLASTGSAFSRSAAGLQSQDLDVVEVLEKPCEGVAPSETNYFKSVQWYSGRGLPYMFSLIALSDGSQVSRRHMSAEQQRRQQASHLHCTGESPRAT